MKRLLSAIVCCLAVLTLCVAPGHADLLVRLKDGRTIRVPVTIDEVAAIEFAPTGREESGADKAATDGTPQNTARPAPAARSANTTGARAGNVIRVAPGTEIASPSAAAKIAKDGDTVLIAAAEYRADVAVWRQDNLTLRGVDGRPHLMAEGQAAGRKAIWVIAGDNVRVENIEFSGARVRDRNGAGIRAEGAGLYIENSYFHDNEMGIMSGRNPDSDIVIRNSEFANNHLTGKTGRRIGHNIYIGSINSFTLTGSKVHGAVKGHNIKSRARVSTITDNEIHDGPNGNASYLVDLSNAGVAILRGNLLHQGQTPENTALVSYGAERGHHQVNRLVITGNRFVNDYQNGVFVHNHTTTPAEIVNNEFTGRGRLLRGAGTLNGNKVTRGD